MRAPQGSRCERPGSLLPPNGELAPAPSSWQRCSKAMAAAWSAMPSRRAAPPLATAAAGGPPRGPGPAGRRCRREHRPALRGCLRRCRARVRRQHHQPVRCARAPHALARPAPRIARRRRARRACRPCAHPPARCSAPRPAGFIPYAGEGFALLIPSKWNPSKEQDFPGLVLRCALGQPARPRKRRGICAAAGAGSPLLQQQPHGRALQQRRQLWARRRRGLQRARRAAAAVAPPPADPAPPHPSHHPAAGTRTTATP